MQLPGVTDARCCSADEHLGAATRMPRQVLRGAQGHLDAAARAMVRTASNASAASTRSARPPRAARFAQPGQHRADVLRLMRQRRVERGDLVVGGPAMGGDQLDGPGLLGRLHHLGDREQRDIDGAARHVAAQRFQQRRQQRGGQMRAVGLQRVEHRRGARGADRRRPDPSCRTLRRAGTASAGSRRSPDSASDLPIARRRFCSAVSPRPAGAAGSTDGMTSRPSSRSTSSTRSAGCTRSGRQLGGVTTSTPASSSATATRAPIWVSRAAVAPVGVAHTGGAVGQVDRHLHRQAVTSPRAAGRRASRSALGSTTPPAISASRAAQRSSAATEMAGSTARS